MKKNAPGLRDIGEFGFIERVSSGCLVRPKGVVRAIGDDAAAFVTPVGRLSLVTTDLLVERVHFLRESTNGFNLGYKAMAVNLSDIAAMGGDPLEAFVSIAIPADCCLDFLDDLYRGMRELATEFQVNILGGDTTSSKQDLVINIALFGSVPADQLLRRDGSRPGDLICSTGNLGDSRAGLHLILNGLQINSESRKRLFEAHILPRPCLREGRLLAAQQGVTAAIDVSDGLSSDLGHLIEQSGTGARIYQEQIPISSDLEQFCREFELNSIDFALAGGEDYCLLFTVSEKNAIDLQKTFHEELGYEFKVLGEMTSSGILELVDPEKKVVSVEETGWNHFRK